MNILEAYINKNKKIIILITGINIKSINKIGDILGNDLSLPVLKINEIIEKDYFKSLDDINIDKLNTILSKNKSYIICGFINPNIKLNIDYNINIKYDSNFFKENKIEESKVIYEFYKNNLKLKPINKFIKFEKNEDNIVDIIFDYLMKSINDNIYNKKTIFNENNNSDNVNEKKSMSGFKNKKLFNWDKEKIYANIDDYNDEMHNIEIYGEDRHELDNDIFKEMDDSSYSQEEKIYFVKDFFYKNFKGGGKNQKNSFNGHRYINDD